MNNSSSAGFPYDIAPVITEMVKQRHSSLRILTAVASALTELGHPAVVMQRQARAALEKAVHPGARCPGYLVKRDESLYALQMNGELLSLDLDRSWKDMLLRLHENAVSGGFGQTLVAEEWRTAYSSAAKPLIASSESVDVRLAVELLLANRNFDYQPADEKPEEVTAEVRQLRTNAGSINFLRNGLCAALREAGVDARGIEEKTHTQVGGARETHIQERVEYGQHGGQVILTEKDYEGYLYYTTPNERGFIERRVQTQEGAHEVHFESYSVVQSVVDLCSKLVAQIVCETMERETAQVALPENTVRRFRR